MSSRKIEKGAEKVQSQRAGLPSHRDIFLLSDSKGRYLQNQQHSHDAVKINFIHIGGFVINNPEYLD